MRRLAPALVIVATASVAARGSDEAAPPDDWLQHCAPCHGVEADGRGAAASSLFPPPRSLRAAAFLKLDDQEIARVIRLGGKATGRSAAMPSFDRTLGANRITALVAYLKKLPRQERSASPLVFAAGDPGAALYAAHCQDCHGSSGMADGKNSALLVPAPRPLPETLGGATEEQIQHAIEGHAWWSAGAMPAFGGVLSDGAILLLARTLAEAARPSSGTAAAEARTGREIFEDLGCRGCHPMAGIEPRPRAPDLASAGTRLRAGWLVTFLQKPVQVRPIGHPPGSHARMPTFGLNAADARDIATALGADPARATMGAADPGLIASGGCLACHRMGADGGRVGPDLALAKDRLRNGGVEDALLGRTAMPARDVTPVEVKAYTRALLGGQKMDYFDHGSIVLGRALMEDLACASCHPIPGLEPPQPVGPDLTFAGERFAREYLAAYLRAPAKVRPKIAARMPDFRLSDDEIARLTDFLMQEREAPRPIPPLLAGSPARSDRDVVEGRAVFDELRCGTCHALLGKPATGEESIGPTLDRVAERLTWDGLTRWLLTPSRYLPGTAMPAFFETDGRPIAPDSYEKLRALRAFLWFQEREPAKPARPSRPRTDDAR